MEFSGILEWVAISYPWGLPHPGIMIHISWISCIGRWILYHCTTWEALIIALLLLFSLQVMSNSFATPRIVSLPVFSVHGFPRQEYWSGLSFPSPGDLADPGSNSHLLLSGGFFTTQTCNSHTIQSTNLSIQFFIFEYTHRIVQISSWSNCIIFSSPQKVTYHTLHVVPHFCLLTPPFSQNY